MNNVCLCIGKYAKTPYNIKFSDISLYSIEELCYYFMERVHLIDDSIVCESLVKWIKEECGLVELAEELEVYVRKHVSVATFVNTILESTGMYDENTVKRIDQVLKKQASLTPIERYKKQAEHLYKQGRFIQALQIYSELLDYLPARDSLGRAELYYNMASIYAMDFAYKQAAQLYYESYLISPNQGTRQAYILACKYSMSDYAYGNFKRENPDWDEDFCAVDELCREAEAKWLNSREKKIVDDIHYCKEEGDLEKYYCKKEVLIGELRKDYKRQTQV